MGDTISSKDCDNGVESTQPTVWSHPSPKAIVSPLWVHTRDGPLCRATHRPVARGLMIGPSGSARHPPRGRCALHNGWIS